MNQPVQWYTKYMSVPFVEKGRSMDGADCWGLACLIYKNELGIILPDYLDVYENTNERDVLAKVIGSEREAHWINPVEPKEFDLVVLNMRGVPMHIGVVTKPNHMVHCAKDVNTTHEHYGTSRWKHKVMGFGRYER